jgi:beta-phosphoglucomutase
MWSIMSQFFAVFDCDGVLVDTETLKFIAWQKILNKEGIKLTRDHYKLVVGNSMTFVVESFEQFFSKKLMNFAPEAFETEYQLLRSTVQVKPIERNIILVKHLAELGFTLAIASSDSRANIKANLQISGISNYFQVILSGMDDLPPHRNKPDPLIYSLACKELGSPNTFIVFEDTLAGAEAGYKAGAIVCALPNEWTLHQDFSKNSHELFLSEVSEHEILKWTLEVIATHENLNTSNQKQ